MSSEEHESQWQVGDLHLIPRGMAFVDHNSPIEDTWVDLTEPHHVWYGLNGAGKTTLLDALRAALRGTSGPGRLIVDLPTQDTDLSTALEVRLAELLFGSDQLTEGPLSKEFAAVNFDSAQARFMRHDMASESAMAGEGPEGLDWKTLIAALLASTVWEFVPVGESGSREWVASPILFAEPGGPWTPYVQAMEQLAEDVGAIWYSRDLGLDLLWQGDVPAGATQAITFPDAQRRANWEETYPYWPFGLMVADDNEDSQVATRRHLLTHSVQDRYSDDDRFDSGPGLHERAKRIEAAANLHYAALLMDAPALHLVVGDEAAWFDGRSCAWKATRFEGDALIPLERLSFAECRWANIAIHLALGDMLKPATRWLVLDEPERGLHRTAEAHLATGVYTFSGPEYRSGFATHSPELLNADQASVSFVRRRSATEPGTVLPMGQFDDLRRDLGLTPADMLRRTRGILLVEGEHDRIVLQNQIGEDLARLGVEIIPTRGAAKLKTVVDSRFLYQFTDAVLFPMVDDLQQAGISRLWERAKREVRTGLPSQVVGKFSADFKRMEQKGAEYLKEFLTSALQNGTFDRVHPLGIPQSDVLACLPVQAFVPRASDWDEVREAAARANNGVPVSETKFKEYLKKQYRADLSSENLARVASAAPTHHDIQAILAAISDRLSH